ncbi:iron complex transport system substrate-binding protein [Pseudonocardia sediminis]|uniref:Iron complex transport system substrate-binding protein n=1 Tax=Pseudonocardia sediminis TaxID=1397368 RepID=A0A4Q7UVR8_PSEST|nr:ABC transporter substrate-binding protein [Pseudonocardia sediminis]RZT85865.1 iron complex transport system substrate-binding protein [Pseudonocardia sediminis]
MAGAGRRSRGLGAVLAALLAAVVLAGCSSGEDASSSEAGTRTIATDKGQLEVPAAPQRIVVLSGGLAGYLYALDAPVVATDTRVLGVTNAGGGFPPSWAAAAQKQGTTELPKGEQLSVEAVAAAKPDLIIGGGQGITAVQAAQAYDRLAAIAPTVLVPRTVTAWQDQLRAVADAAGRTDRVEPLLGNYRTKLDQVKASIAPPAGESTFVLSYPGDKIYVVPPTAALPVLAKDVGIVPDPDVLTKARNPRLASTGDSFELSAELLPQVVDAPNVFVVNVNGKPAAELAKDPVWAQLPAFRAGSVHELPATSYRPDYDAALSTLDILGQEFPKTTG